MNSSLIRKFCESRSRWPIVATAAALIALAAVAPAAEEYFDNRSRRSELTEELDRARRTAGALAEYEGRHAAAREKLDALEQRTVDDSTLAAFRSRLVDIIRESGCQIRQIEVGAPTRRPWMQADNPLADAEQPDRQGAATSFQLERRSVLLVVDGPMPNVHDLFSRLDEERTISHPRRLQMQAASTGGESVVVELEFWLFALARTPA